MLLDASKDGWTALCRQEGEVEDDNVVACEVFGRNMNRERKAGDRLIEAGAVFAKAMQRAREQEMDNL